MRRSTLSILVFLGVMCAGSARAQSVVQYLEAASANDAAFASARAQREADQHWRAISAAGLWPSVTLAGSSGSNQYRRQDTPFSVAANYSYKPLTWALQVSQPLFNAERLAAVTEGELRGLRAELVLEAAWQDLVLRLGGAWYGYLLDLEQVDLVQAQLDSYRAQQEQAQRLRTAGVATRTDVEESAARAQIAAAELVSAKASATIKALQFAKIVGVQPPARPFDNGVAGETLPPDLLATPVDEWVQIAQDNGVGVRAQKVALEIARTQLKREKAAYLPTVNLTASRQINQNGTYFTHSDATTQLGVQLSMNLYEGGGTKAQVRQAAALIDRAEADVVLARQDAGVRAADAAHAVATSQERLRALAIALSAAEISLQGMQAGQKVGLRTSSDVLNAVQQLYSVRRDMARERYTAVMRSLELRLLRADPALVAYGRPVHAQAPVAHD